MKKEKLKRKLTKTKKKLAKAEAELDDLRSRAETTKDAPPEVKIMAAQ